MTSRRPFLLLRIDFPGRPIFIQLPPAYDDKFARQLELIQGTEEGSGQNEMVAEESVDVTERVRSEFVNKLRLVLSKDTPSDQDHSQCD